MSELNATRRGVNRMPVLRTPFSGRAASAHPACMVQDDYRGPARSCAEPLPAIPPLGVMARLRTLPDVLKTWLTHQSGSQDLGLLATPGVEFVPGVRTADGTPATVMTVDSQLVRVESFFRDGVQTVAPSEVRRLPGLIAGSNATFFGFGASDGTFGDLRGIGRTYRDEAYAANYDAISDRRYFLAIAPDGGVTFGQGGLSEREVSGSVAGFVGGMGRLFNQAEGPQLEQEVRSGAFERRLRAMVQDRSFPNTDLTSALPRTLVGRMKDGRLLLVAIGQGRDRGVGANFEEAALLMRRLGAVEAYTLDGGGSTHVVVPGMLETRTDGRAVKSYLVITPRGTKRS